MTHRTRRARLLVLPLLAIATLGIPAGGQTTGSTPSFQGLGQMPGATAGGTYANGISGDGKVAVGYAWFGSVDEIGFTDRRCREITRPPSRQPSVSR